ncbi:DUF5106 domain-containing protein [Sphingobacterium faecale]|uniref:DUF5106 domain-containing protein n=1 Tax=Sphingobacterium faecale TaxID=2803775 RepID=A0ABS1QXV4_9SPHI|nr:DUF5106 domain-containing protein [Sphingobacterium faecale]MBL1407263.1 DUF5106 domain-containing protein [Sphingobacterium faecale]
MRINCYKLIIDRSRFIFVLGVLLTIGLSSCSRPPKTDILTFWNDLDFDKIDLDRNVGEIDRLLINFVMLLDKSSLEKVDSAIHIALGQAESNPRALRFLSDRMQERLYDPNSTLRNDRYYSTVLHYLISSNRTQESDRIRYRTQLALVQKNLPGAVANNFSFQQATGEQQDLNSLKGTYKLVMFYHPLCYACKSALADLKAIDRFLQRTKQSKMRLLTVCAAGDEKDWRDYEVELPKNWINGYNKEEEIIRNDLYDLKAFPTFYLMDQDNRVLLKDTDMVRLVSYISSWT